MYGCCSELGSVWPESDTHGRTSEPVCVRLVRSIEDCLTNRGVLKEPAAARREFKLCTSGALRRSFRVTAQCCVGNRQVAMAG